MRGQEFKAREKKVQKLTRDGLVEQNRVTGEEVRISQRTADVSFGPERTQDQMLGRSGTAKKQQKLRKSATERMPIDVPVEPQTETNFPEPETSVAVRYEQTEATSPDIASEQYSSENEPVVMETDAPPVMRNTSDIPLNTSVSTSDHKQPNTRFLVRSSAKDKEPDEVLSRSARRRRNAKRLNFKPQKAERESTETRIRFENEDMGLPRLSDDKAVSDKYYKLGQVARDQEDSASEAIPQEERLQFDRSLERKASKSSSQKRRLVKTASDADAAKAEDVEQSEPSAKSFDAADKSAPVTSRQVGEKLRGNGLVTEKGRLQFDHAPPVTTDHPQIKKRQPVKPVNIVDKSAPVTSRQVGEKLAGNDLATEKGRLRFDNASPVMADRPQIKKQQPQSSVNSAEKSTVLTSRQVGEKLMGDNSATEKGRLNFDHEPPVKAEHPPIKKRQPVKSVDAADKSAPVTSRQVGEKLGDSDSATEKGRLQFDHAPPVTTDHLPIKKRQPVKSVNTADKSVTVTSRQVGEKLRSDDLSTEKGRLHFDQKPTVTTEQPQIKKQQPTKPVISADKAVTSRQVGEKLMGDNLADDKGRFNFNHEPTAKLDHPSVKKQTAKPVNSSEKSAPVTSRQVGEKSKDEDSSPAKSRLHFEDEQRPVKTHRDNDDAEDTIPENAESQEPEKPSRQQVRLHFEDAPPQIESASEDGFTSRRQKSKYEKAEKRVEQASRKLEKAQSKLPTKRRVRLEKQYKNAGGKVRHRLRFEEETIPENAQPSLTKRAGSAVLRTAETAVIMKGHEKMREVERENVAVEASHKIEFAAERGAGRFLRWNRNRIKHKSYENVRKAERKLAEAKTELAWQTALRDNPELRRKNALAKAIQKRKIRQKYAQAAHEAKQTVQHTQNILNATGQIIRATAQTVAAHKTLFILFALLAVIVVMFSAGLASCTAMLSGIQSSYISASYMANEDDITNADLYYSEMETDLQIDIDKTEENYPGYAGYTYDIGEISHNPYELMAYLSTAFNAFTFDEIKDELERIFGLQYTLTREVTTGNILKTTLTVKPLSEVIEESLENDEQRDRYEVYMQTLGNRQAFGNPFDFAWMSYVSSPFGWRVHPITGDKQQHTGIDIAVAEGTEIHAVQDGRVVSAGENGGYGLCVVIEDDKGYQSLYAHCSSISVSVGQEVKRDDVIAAVGSTGDSTGPHLHLEVMLNGEYLNPYYFVETGGYNGAAPGTPGGPEIPAYSGEPMGDGSFAAMLTEAQKFIGRPYVWGGSSPATGFDCSGYVSWVINQSGVGSVGRSTAQGLYNACTPVSRENAKPGDLVFFTKTYSTTDTVTHVGILVQDGKMLHCGNPIGYADLGNSYWSSHFYAYGRLS